MKYSETKVGMRVESPSLNEGIIEKKNNEIKLGANGIGILMFIEYMQTFNNKEYEKLVLDLGNGIGGTYL